MRLSARLMWLAAAISIAVAAFPAAVGADQPSCQPAAGPVGGIDPSTAGGVNIHVTANNTVIWCSAAVIEANSDIPNGTNYQVRSTDLSPSATPVSNVISVSQLLSLAGVNPASVNHTEIARLNGVGSSSLDTADLIDPAAQFLDELKPIFWINGSETQYLRPLRSPSDTNGDDAIVASNGDPLDLYVYSGPLLTVAGEARPNPVAPKQVITFTAHVTDATAADGALTYTWNLQDGSTATGKSVTHSYAAGGAWYPVVTVQGAGNDSGGVSPPIAVTVGTVPKGTKPGKSGGTNPNKHAGGPKRSAGNTPQTAPTHTQSSGRGKKQSSPNNQTAGQAGNSGSPSTTPAQSTTPTQTTTPTTPAQTTSTPAAITPRTPAAPKADHNPAKRRPPLAHTHVQPQHRPGPTVVRGRLIADVIPVSAAQLAQQNGAGPASSAHAPSASVGGDSVAPIAGIAGGCVVMLLLGSGAGLELRSKRRPVAPPPAG